MPFKSKPQPLHILPKAGYPKLSDYVFERRKFLKKLFFGALSAGVGNGVLTGCAESYSAGSRKDEPNADNDDREYTGTGDSSLFQTNRPDSEVIEPDNSVYVPDATPIEVPPKKNAPDASDPDPIVVQPDAAPESDATNPIDPPPVDPDWNIAGGMVEPEYYTVTLPASGMGYAYLGVDQELQYTVSFITYSIDLANYFLQNENQGLNLINTVCSGYTCETLNLGAIEPEFISVLEDHFRQQANATDAYIESLSFTIHSCLSMPMGGVPPAPEY